MTLFDLLFAQVFELFSLISSAMSEMMSEPVGNLLRNVFGKLLDAIA